MFPALKIASIFLSICLISDGLQVSVNSCFNFLKSSEPFIEDDQIDLKELEKKGNMTRYYKYTSILYFRGIERRTNISQGRSKDLEELEDRKTKGSFFNPLNEEVAYVGIIDTTISVLSHYHAILEKENLSYMHKAFYYRALTWLKLKMIPNEKYPDGPKKEAYDKLERKIEEYLKSEIAVNDLSDIIRENSPLDIKKESMDIVRLKEFSEFGFWEDTIMNLYHLVYTKDEFINTLYSRTLKIPRKVYELHTRPQTVYERIADEADEEKFFNKFYSKPFMMLIYMDSVIYAETLPITKYVPIDLKDLEIQTLTSRTAKLKYTNEFAYNYLRTSKKVKEYLSDSENPHRLRNQCYSFLYSRILKHIENHMNKLGFRNTETNIKRVFYARAVIWLFRTIWQEIYVNQSNTQTISEPEIENDDKTEAPQKVSDYLKIIINREHRNNPIIRNTTFVPSSTSYLIFEGIDMVFQTSYWAMPVDMKRLIETPTKEEFSLCTRKDIENVNYVEDLLKLGLKEEQLLNSYYHPYGNKEYIGNKISSLQNEANNEANKENFLQFDYEEKNNDIQEQNIGTNESFLISIGRRVYDFLTSWYYK